MTLTKGTIARLRFPGRLDISDELETRLLREFGKEPHTQEHSEQDLHEQVRKYVNYYNSEKGSVSPAK